MNLLRDAIGLLFALGHRTAEAVVGHDFGASVAACARWCGPTCSALVLMSAPFGGPPVVPFATAGKPPARGARHPRGPGRPAAAAQALPVVLLDPAGQ